MDRREVVPIEMKDGQSIFAELLKEERKQVKLVRLLLLVNTVLATAVIIAFVIIIPRLTAIVSNTESTLADIQSLAGQAETALAGIDEMVENANAILVENASGMNEAIDNFNKVDFDSLNEAIRNLSEAVEPLAGFAKMFQ